ncbi:nucleoside transporter family [Cordyceps fumosorosea ARSEF 2679]|uniref:Nucleoside transporter family n=1 Tax=Cordyceps fumosorosea (strain ARSEF 2679) TaxID=1081104 RepID=A0A167ZER5_CORFA|nr:nucleoside transporter family [Cordyceps fumosorosea ARSEF 2679]OAA67424.1 nucleoside transporter family [Cordyceps fumosorosea ARSEF 2679]
MKNSERGVPSSQCGSSSHTAEYEPLTGPETPTEMQPGDILIDDDTASSQDDSDAPPFSWVDYGVFGFLGMAMLWAWNMFLAAAPYFESRFQGSPWIEANFQPTIMTVSTATSLAVVLTLTKLQRAASYPFRIACGLIINAATFALLTTSTTVALGASPRAYFAFVLAMVAATSVATGLLQNGALAFAAGFGRPEYMQALVTGQSVAGVLPALSELVSVLVFPARRERRAAAAPPAPRAEGKTSAFVYFLAAVAISVVAMVAMVPLVRHHKRNTEYRALNQADDDDDNDITAAACDEDGEALRKAVPMSVLFAKLQWLASGIALVFITTMFFPVFTAKIRSVNEPSSDTAAPSGGSAIFGPDAFIPLAFFFWNLGDFGGRLSTALSAGRGLGANAGHGHGGRPRLLFKLAALRVVQLPLYLLCNIGGRGAAVPSDVFYLLLVQAPFGFTNGWLCSRLMTSAGSWVEESERAAAGGFMGLCLMVGLAVGSVLSFSITGI